MSDDLIIELSDGIPGPSAYAVAVANGFSGTEAEWLASLKGADSTVPGPSAYLIAVAAGFQGTETEWLASLKGADSTVPGPSAYQLAVNAGFTGTEAEWLLSLKGADSTVPGPSAYQIAVTAGFTGTEAEWLASLKGADSTVPGPKGDAGDSAYQVAVTNGFTGTEAEWIASLKGEGTTLTKESISEALGLDPIGDAPTDDGDYLRKNGSWVSLESLFAPVNLELPVLSPTDTQTGIPYSCSTGTWSRAPIAYAYQWQVSTDGSSWDDIAGATSSSFTPDASFAGKSLRCQVTAENVLLVSLSVASAATAPLVAPIQPSFPPGAIAYWSLDDDGTGNVSLVDSTGNGYDLTNNNGVALGTGVGGTGAAVTNYYNYSNFTISPATGLACGTGDFSVAGWFKSYNYAPDAAYGGGGYPTLFSLGDFYGGAGLGFRPTSDGMGFQLLLPGVEAPSLSYPFELDTFYFWCITRESGEVTVYINAVSIGSVANDGDQSDDSELLLGNRYGQGQAENFDGAITRNAMWHRALSPEEVTLLYGNGTPPAYSA